MTKKISVLLVVSICFVLVPGVSPATMSSVLIIQDELPQMEVLAKFLREEGKLPVKITEQSSSPHDLSPNKVVIVFIHKDLHERTEKSIIEYTRNGGKLICLHHSISSKKAQNKFYFDFLGCHSDRNPNVS